MVRVERSQSRDRVPSPDEKARAVDEEMIGRLIAHALFVAETFHLEIPFGDRWQNRCSHPFRDCFHGDAGEDSLG